MDYFNLSTEYENIVDNSKQGIETLCSFKNFLNVIHKNLESLTKETSLALGSLSNDFLNETPSSLTHYFFDFTKSVLKHIRYLQSQTIKLNKELIEPLGEFISHLKEQEVVNSNEFKELINEVNAQKKKCDNLKDSYFAACRAAELQEKRVLECMDKNSKEKKNEEEASRQHSILVNLRALAEEECQKYKNELKKTNTLYASINSQYFPLIQRIKDNEDSRRSFTKFHFEKLEQYLTNHVSSLTGLMKTVQEIHEIDVDSDMKHFKEKFNYVYDVDRVPKEDFVNFDIYRRDVEAMNKKNKMLLMREGKRDFDNELDAFTVMKENKSLKLIFNSTELKLIENIVTSNSTVDQYQFELLNKKIAMEEKYATDFIDKLLDLYNNKLTVKIPKEDSFYKLSVLLLSVLRNNTVQENNFNINIAVVCLAEKTYFQSDANPFNKIYLCKIISEENLTVKSKNFWSKLIEIKIHSEIEREAKRRIQKKRKAKTGTKNESSGQTNSIFKTVLGGAASIFNQGRTKEEEKELIEVKQSIEKEEVIKVLKDFITHFSFFNVDSNDVVDLISCAFADYSLEKENSAFNINYIVAVVNSNMYSVKNSRFDLKLNSNLEYFDNENVFMNKNYLNSNKIRSNVIKCVLTSMKYLTIKEMVNILRVSKSWNNLIKKKIYRSYLLNSKICTLEQRIKIWEILLKDNSQSKNTKEETPKKSYEEICKDIEKEPKPIFEVISLDTKRTPFFSDVEENRSKIQKILSCLALSHNQLEYVQGLNYIAAFLLQYTKSESISFEIFDAILSNTSYALLFENELHRLNKYFYVFERLMFIYLPEVSAHLKRQSLSATYFISPWFITLFTNSYQYLSDKNSPKVLVWILDLFMLEGWKAIMKIGICLLKHFEGKIISLKYEDLLHFLVNDILKYDFFQPGNYERLKRIYTSIFIEGGLIENIENEFEIKEKYK